MGFGIKKEGGSNSTPSEIVNFDKLTPTTVGVVFTPNTPATEDILYLSSVDASTWIWNGTAYVTYASPSAPSTEWYLTGTTIDAGSNKTASISRNNSVIALNNDSYFNGVRVGKGSGNDVANTVAGANASISNTVGTSNVWFGYNSGYNNTTGIWNTFIGRSSGYNNTVGEYNVYVGTASGFSNTTGSNNTFLGVNSGRYITNGTTPVTIANNSVFLGKDTKALADNQTNQIVIGYNAIGKGSDTVNIGNSSITNTYLNGAVTFNNAFTLPTTDGTADYVLKTNGAGVVTWASGGGSGVCGIKNSSGVYTYYATLNLAITAAVSGQTVDLLTDITETGSVTVTTKAGVKINGNGYTYTLSVDDAINAITQGAYIEMSNIRILRTGRANNATGRAFLGNLSTAPALRCQNVIFENTYGIGMQHKGDIHGLTIISYGVCLDSAFESAGAFNCNFTSSNSIGINLPSSSSPIINCNVNGLTGGIISGFGTVYNSIGRTTSGNGIQATRVVNSTGVSSSGTGVQTNNGNNCVGISTSGIGLSGTFTNSTGISTSGYGGTNGTKTNCTLISSSNYASFQENLNNSFLQSTTNVPLWLSTGKLVNACTVSCLWDNVGGHAINTTSASTGVDIRNCNLTVTNASAYCINGASASTFKYASNTFKGSTTAVNTTNVTQGITNTEDNQGNILI
jgi:hypothetical protein